MLHYLVAAVSLGSGLLGVLAVASGGEGVCGRFHWGLVFGLRSFAGYLGLALVFVWGRALWGV